MRISLFSVVCVLIKFMQVEGFTVLSEPVVPQLYMGARNASPDASAPVGISYCFEPEFCDVSRWFTWFDANQATCSLLQRQVINSLDIWSAYVLDLSFVQQPNCTERTQVNFTYGFESTPDDSVLGVTYSWIGNDKKYARIVLYGN